MKYALLLTLAFSTPAFAASGWEQSITAASSAYELDYKADQGRSASAPAGFFLERGDGEYLTRVYFVEETALRAFDYGCHQHSAEEFDCHRENRADLGAYTRSSSLYSAAEIAKATGLALELFESKEASESAITSLKAWEAEGNIRFSIRFEKEGEKSSFIACHYHGSEMDCHRKRDAGPGEPQN